MADVFVRDMPEAQTGSISVAFVVMPFRERKVVPRPNGAPAKIDCDRLWDRAIRPALTALGYVPIRADIESGSVIVKDMLERLAFADLVLADMSLANGNVYYEVGIRHVAKDSACVLIAADWSSQLFDTAQMRTARYPLRDGSVPDAEAATIKQVIEDAVRKYRASRTPFHELVTARADSSVFVAQVERISRFQGAADAARRPTDPHERERCVQALIAETSAADLENPEIAIELLTLVRDALSWEQFSEYIQQLPEAFRRLPVVREQALLAQSGQGDHLGAIDGLKRLIAEVGDSAERRGLLGGRYKRLWRAERDARVGRGQTSPGLREHGYLGQAIDAYQAGMDLDLNEYYCASNLPLLLRSRRALGDDARAAFAAELTVRACERAIERGVADEWVRPTLLVAAFGSGNLDRARALAVEVASQGVVHWKLKSALADLENCVELTSDPGVKPELAALLDELKALLPAGAQASSGS